jgi:hypothetical protein
MSRMSDAARNNEKNRGVKWKDSGAGQKVNKSYKQNLCRHANSFGDCDECTRESRARAARATRIQHRAVRVKKAKKKAKKKGILNCSVIALALLAVPAGVLYGVFEAVKAVV